MWHEAVILSFTSNFIIVIANKGILSVLYGSFSNDDGDGKKSNGFIKQNKHHVFLYISLPSLHDCGVKMSNFTFYEVRKQATTNFSFSFLAGLQSLEEVNSREIHLLLSF